MKLKWKEKAPKGWNDGFTLEAADRLDTVIQLIYERLSGHQAIKRVGAQKDIKRILDELGDIYQAVGKHLGEGDA